MIFDKDAWGWISVAFTILGVAPYIYFVLNNTIRPHVFSWFIWGTLTAIGFAAQYAEGAGPGSWATGSASVGCFCVAFLALRRGERHITRSDWISFLAALAAIPLWYFTKDPLWSVILISIIDVLGYFPTVRKSYHKPHEELIFTHFIGTVKFAFSFLAMEQWLLTTWLYPAAISTANIALVIMLIVRREKLAQQSGLKI